VRRTLNARCQQETQVCLSPRNRARIFRGGVRSRQRERVFPRPTPTLLFADGSMSAQRVRWFSARRIFIHCSNILCLTRRCRVGNVALSARRGTGLCNMLDVTFPSHFRANPRRTRKKSRLLVSWDVPRRRRDLLSRTCVRSVFHDQSADLGPRTKSQHLEYLGDVVARRALGYRKLGRDLALPP
jgi:hypothetical protein